MPEISLSWPQSHHIQLYIIYPRHISLQRLYITSGHIGVFKRTKNNMNTHKVKQMLFLNQRKRKNGHRNIFMTKSSRKDVPDARIDRGAP